MTFSLYVGVIFTVILSIFGLSYEGAEESPIYIITVLGTNALAMGYVMLQEIQHHRQAKGSTYPYLLLLIVPILCGVEIAFGKIHDMTNAIRMLQFFYALAASGIVIGTYCYRYDKFCLIVKNLELITLLSTMGLIIALPSMYIENAMHATIGGGGNHQTISYTAATNFSIFLIGLRSKNLPSAYRYRFFASKYYYPIALILMIANAVICIIGGGRGGAVLLAATLFISLYYFSRKNFGKSLLLIVLGATAFYFISTNISLWGINNMFHTGFDRAFSYIKLGELDMTETSGRDIVYERTQELIRDVPLCGYGLFHQYDLCWEKLNQPYSHNLFYEWILQGGYLYLLLWIGIYITTLIKAHKLILHKPEYAYLIAIIGYPFVMLLFSGTYMNAPLFWFSVIYVNGYYRKARLKYTILRSKSLENK